MIANKETPSAARVADERLNELIAEEVGARSPTGSINKLLAFVAFSWAMFQLYVASSLPFILEFGFFDDTEQRVIHLGFALFLGFSLYPAFKTSSRTHVPMGDWLLAIGALVSTLFIVVFYEEVSSRAGGSRTFEEIALSITGLLLVLEISRRALGWPLVIIAVIFIGYALFGPYMPDLISHRGASLNRLLDHLWLTTEGVFGLPLGVSSSFVFLFVLFGALLEKAGAGNFFIQLSFSLLGHLRGGPAKAAVVASGLTGLISGSAIANVATTGTFTIPLMKRIGFSSEKAASIEVSASINGQIMPPVMGAAAFLMTEFVGISYFEVITHAFLPAIISYIGLFYIVHLESAKMNLPILEKLHKSSVIQRLMNMSLSICLIVLLSGVVYVGVGFVKTLFGELTSYVCAVILFVSYLILLWKAAQYPEIEVDDPNAPLLKIPDTLPILMAGLYFAIPIGVLIWGLMIERFSPGHAVIWAILTLVIIMLTQHPLISLFRKTNKSLKAETIKGVYEVFEGTISGSKNMVGIALAMGSAGIIVGVVSLTGVGLIMTEVIDSIAGGSVILMLLLTAVMCMVLGMGLPTTANYIVVASVMAQPFVTLASQHGIVVPLIAVHLFVFYFGLISGTTPPVAVDAYAGAAVARADPMKTAINSFFYDIRTSILPFIFIFNPGLLLIGMDYWWEYVMVAITAIIAMLAFCAATKGFFFCLSRKWESAALLLVAFTLIRPGYWLNQIEEPYQRINPINIVKIVQEEPTDSSVRLLVKGENFSGDIIDKVVVFSLGPQLEGQTGEDRLYNNVGFNIEQNEGQVLVDDIKYDSPAQLSGMDYGWQVVELQVPNERMAKEWFYLPALFALFLVVLVQLKRKTLSSTEQINERLSK
ncbi:TRAP transporter permease [Marinomonas sp. 2405UD68-3]|uniref:TRAP transporter permease n=1 Tax=Marinomonas sp. 2405UD68-3 TaxID=3391835 RepID=UPI0039C8C9F3